MIGLTIDTLSTMLNLTQILSVIDNILELIRSHGADDACRVVNYAIAITTIDSDGRLHAHMLMPEDQTNEQFLILREQCQELLPTE
jgi:hypothetical protein